MSIIRLTNLHAIRTAHKLSRPSLASLTDIPTDRLRDLELRRGKEPFFDEALALAHVLTGGSILRLLAMQPFDRESLLELAGVCEAADMAAWRSGHRAPLYVALRVAARFGLGDPARLVASPLQQQVWSVLEHAERTSDAGRCPWCRAAFPAHEPGCLPALLFHAKPLADAGAALRVARSSAREDKGRIAWGLRRLRVTHYKTQAQMADIAGMHPNYYSILENCKRPLAAKFALKLVEHFKIEYEELFRPDTDLT